MFAALLLQEQQQCQHSQFTGLASHPWVTPAISAPLSCLPQQWTGLAAQCVGLPTPTGYQLVTHHS